MNEFDIGFFLKFIKFSVVGFSGLVIDFGITYFLKEKAKVNKYLANATGFLAAASSNFLFNRIWTFESNDPLIFQQYTKFVTISIVGLVFNHFIIKFLHGKLTVSFYWAKMTATLVVVFWNFTANYLYTFATQ